MNTKKYNYSYANRIGNALTEPFYKLYKTDTKYLETLDLSGQNTSEKVFYAVNMLLLNLIAIPLSLPLWFIGKIIVQYTSSKVNYSLNKSKSTISLHESPLKINLLAMVRDHKESTIIRVFSHGSWYSLLDYRIEPNRKFGAIPGSESARNTDSVPEKIHNFLEQQMILTKLGDSNRLIETIQKKLNTKIPNDTVEPIITDSSEVIDPVIKNPQDHAGRSYISNIRSLRYYNPDVPLMDLMDVMREDNYRKIFDNNIAQPVITESPEIVEKEIDSAIKNPENQKFSSNYDYSNYLVELVSKNHELPLEEAINFVATNFYSGNDITYQGTNCLLREIGALS